MYIFSKAHPTTELSTQNLRSDVCMVNLYARTLVILQTIIFFYNLMG